MHIVGFDMASFIVGFIAGGIAMFIFLVYLTFSNKK